MEVMQPSRPLEPNPPASLAKGTPADEARSARLLAYLDAESPLEDVAQRAQREMLLNELNTLLKEWIRELAVSKAIYPDYESAAEAGGKLYIAGSYRLGINNPDGDVDAVAVVPEFVTRDDFFSDAPGGAAPAGGVKQHPGWVHRLRLFPEVEHLNLIRGAGAEIIELKVGGCDVDMGIGVVRIPTIPPKFNILDDEVLRGVTRQDMIALNGPRVTELVGKLVEQQYSSFTVLVRAVRLWAKQRGLYSNKMGYMGGVNFNIMCALVCQLYPNLPPAALLAKFFVVFSNWSWPKPVWITKPYKTAGATGSAGGAGAAAVGWDHEVFGPETARNAFMPVITPAYPASNSLYNVSMTTLGIMMYEFRRGAMTCAEILSVDPSPLPSLSASAVAPGTEATGQGQPGPEIAWDRLFAPSEFFLKYDNYLVVDIRAGSEGELAKWKGFVESRVRLLVMELERSGLPLLMVHPYPKTYERTERIPAEEIAAMRQREREAAAAAAAGGNEEAAVAEAAAADVGGHGATATTVPSAAATAAPQPHVAPVEPALGVRAGMKRLASDMSRPDPGDKGAEEEAQEDSAAQPHKMPHAAVTTSPSRPSRALAPLDVARVAKSANYDYGDDEGLTTTASATTAEGGTAAGSTAIPSTAASMQEDEGDQALLPADFDTAVEDAHGGGDGPQAHMPTEAQAQVLLAGAVTKVKEEAVGSSVSILPGIAELQPLPAVSAEPAPHAQAQAGAGGDGPATTQAQQPAAEEPPQYRTVFSIFLGLEPDRERIKKQALDLNPVLRAFKNDKLYSWADRKDSMMVKIRVPKWKDLPAEVHPDGPEIAEMQRKEVKERLARESAAYAAEMEAQKVKVQQQRVVVRGQSGAVPGTGAVAGGTGAPADSAAAGTEAALLPAPLRPEERKYVAGEGRGQGAGGLFPSPTPTGTGIPGLGGATGGIPGLTMAVSSSSGSGGGGGAIPGLGGSAGSMRAGTGPGAGAGAGDKRGREGPDTDEPAPKKVAPAAPVVMAPRPTVAALPVAPARPVVATASRPAGAAPAGAGAGGAAAKGKFKVQLLGNITYWDTPGCSGTSVPVTAVSGQCQQSGNNSFLIQCGAAGGVAYYCSGPNCDDCTALVQPFGNNQCLGIGEGNAAPAQPPPPAPAQPPAPAPAQEPAPARGDEGDVGIADDGTTRGVDPNDFVGDARRILQDGQPTIVARSVTYVCAAGGGDAPQQPQQATGGIPAPAPARPGAEDEDSGAATVTVATAALAAALLGAALL